MQKQKQIRTNLTERLLEGRQLARSKHKEGEAAKLGNLRAGNSGMMSTEGEVAGSCHRVAHLRQLGVEIEEPNDSKLIMFQMGLANEDVVYEDLLHTAAEDEAVLREEQIPIEWFTSNGTKVTGRPDMVVCRVFSAGGVTNLGRGDKDIFFGDLKVPIPPIVPIFGVEIKSIASVWTSRDVLFEKAPKLPHLIQAGHYSWKLGVPFRLLYKQYVNQAVPSWAGKLFPRQGEEYSEHISYNEKGDIKCVEPFEIAYELEFNKKGQLQFRREGTEKWTVSLVNSADIERYYEYVSTMATEKKLGPRPLTIDALGSGKNYSNCDYCPLLETCDKHEESGYTKWLKEVTKVAKVLHIAGEIEVKK